MLVECSCFRRHQDLEQSRKNILDVVASVFCILEKNLTELKIERELRTSYIVETKKAETFAKASKVLVAKLPRLANAWGQEN